MKKRCLVFLLALCMVVTLLPTTARAAESVVQFAGGNGTVDNPYQITTAEHFDNIRSNLSACYILQNDIDLSNASTWIPIETFSGLLDGNGHAVTGFYVNNSFEFDYTKSYCGLGLFGVVSDGGIIQNLQIKNANIYCTSKTFAVI